MINIPVFFCKFKKIKIGLIILQYYQKCLLGKFIKIFTVALGTMGHKVKKTNIVVSKEPQSFQAIFEHLRETEIFVRKFFSLGFFPDKNCELKIA